MRNGPRIEAPAVIALAKIEAARRLRGGARVPLKALDEVHAVLGPVLDAAHAWGTSAASGAGACPMPDLAALLREAADAIAAQRQTALTASLETER